MLLIGVSGAVYWPFSLVEMSIERIEGGGWSSEQAVRKCISLPANGVYWPTAHWPALYLEAIALKSRFITQLFCFIGLLTESLPADSLPANSLPANNLLAL